MLSHESLGVSLALSLAFLTGLLLLGERRGGTGLGSLEKGRLDYKAARCEPLYREGIEGNCLCVTLFYYMWNARQCAAGAQEPLASTGPAWLQHSGAFRCLQTQPGLSGWLEVAPFMPTQWNNARGAAACCFAAQAEDGRLASLTGRDAGCALPEDVVGRMGGDHET